MIFVTVGMQMPFTRLISTVDRWAAGNSQVEILAQVGKDSFSPLHMNWVRFFSPIVFRKIMQSAQLVVAHGGTGTILTAMQYGIPLLVLPRKMALGETRCDHQFATSHRFAEIGAVEIACDENELLKKLDTFNRIEQPRRIGTHASALLLKSISEFINDGDI